MKILGLIGGISWVSTVDYYRLINLGVNEKLGGLNFAECMIYSFNYHDIKRNNDAEDWDKTLEMMTKASLNLKAGGAQAIVLCANTMHLVADRLEQNIQIPVIHIASATANSVKAAGVKKVGLLGTKFTMERNFFTDKLYEKGIEVIIPGDEDRNFLHYTIFEELGRGIIDPETKRRYIGIINKLVADGAEGIILGCTEIPLLVNNSDVNIPLFNTTTIHSKAAVEFIVG